MSLEMILQKAGEYRSKTRKELMTSIAMVLIVIGFSVFGILHASNAGLRLLFVLATGWALVGQSFMHRGMWSEDAPADATFSTGLEFYRREVERRQSLVRRILEWSFGPIVLSVFTFIVTFFAITRGGSLRIRAVSVMPFTVLFVIWMIAYLVLRARGQRKLQQELDELGDLEKVRRG